MDYYPPRKKRVGEETNNQEENEEKGGKRENRVGMTEHLRDYFTTNLWAHWVFFWSSILYALFFKFLIFEYFEERFFWWRIL